MSSIVTLTLNPAVDKTSSVQQVVSERKLRCTTPSHHPGGGGINVARAIKKLGGEAVAFWTRGGIIGHQLYELLEQENVTQVPFEIEGKTRENLNILEEGSGEQYRFGMPGPKLRDSEINRLVEQLITLDPTPEYLVMSGSSPTNQSIYLRIAESMPPTCRIVLDTTGERLQKALGPTLFLIKPNLRELRNITNKSIDNDQELQEVTQSLISERKAQVVITSLGSGGAMLTSKEHCQKITSPTVKIRSKVGAGDSMVGGIVYALTQGKSLLEATRFGAAAGAATVMTSGTELCRKEDAERLFEIISS